MEFWERDVLSSPSYPRGSRKWSIEMRFRGELCESAKKGHCCIDDLCRGADVTLCGFDKELYEQITRDMEDLEDRDYEDEEEL